MEQPPFTLPVAKLEESQCSKTFEHCRSPECHPSPFTGSAARTKKGLRRSGLDWEASGEAANLSSFG